VSATGTSAPGKGIELPAQLSLVALDREGVVGAAVQDEVVSVSALGVHRIGGDHDAGEVVDPV
jgi:hypothetical protein